jgi:hypothetical protein
MNAIMWAVYLCLGMVALPHGVAAYAVGRPAGRLQRVAIAPRSALLTLSSAAAAGPGGDGKWYRTLGITPDASYDEITDAFAELVATAGADEARIALLERARDSILDARLKMRLSGQGAAVRDPTVRPKVKRDWLKPLKSIGRYFERPTGAHALKMSCIFLGFAAASLVAPAASDQMSFFSILFGPAFVYSRGMPEPVRDDFGQVGEILPTKPVPALLAGLITLSFAGVGYLFAVLYLSIIIPPSLVPINALCNSMVAFSVWIAALFVKTQVDN